VHAPSIVHPFDGLQSLSLAGAQPPPALGEQSPRRMQLSECAHAALASLPAGGGVHAAAELPAGVAVALPCDALPCPTGDELF
jgi:hypothetical protein